MKISTLLFQTAALVGAMSFTKAQEGPSPLGNMTGFDEPAFRPPVTEFSLAIEGALKALINPEDYICEGSVLQSYTSKILEAIEDIDTFRLLYNDYRLTEWLFSLLLSSMMMILMMCLVKAWSKRSSLGIASLT
jgi:hypothetical protein